MIFILKLNISMYTYNQFVDSHDLVLARNEKEISLLTKCFIFTQSRNGFVHT